jgi:ubiquitin-activating enzyme E1
LRAFNFGLKGETDPQLFLSALEKVHVPAFKSNKTKKIAATEEEAKEMAEKLEDDHDANVKALTAALPPPSSLAGYRLHPSDFEKDDDSNFHIDFITACSNLRARNYEIKEVSRHETKFTAGKIIPAIATTTALVTGLVCLEMYKLLREDTPVEAFRNTFVNLALPLFALSEPNPPAFTTAKVKSGEWKWSLWDAVEVDIGDCCLQELLDHFEEKYGLEINMLSYGPSMLYYNFKKNTKEKMSKPLSQLAVEVSKKEIDPSDKFLVLEACVNDEDDEDVEIPYLRLRFR